MGIVASFSNREIETVTYAVGFNILELITTISGV
jgi:hypothetical protein